MVICCGRLVVVSSIPPGDFFFVFYAKLLYWGAQRRAARDFGGAEKALDGDPLIGRDWVPQRQKPRSWRGIPPVLRVHQGHSGALFWVDQNPEPHARRPQKTEDLPKKHLKNRPAESN